VPDAFTILLDSPDTPTTKVQIAKLGDDFHHSRYGDFRITAEEVGDWKRNLAKLPGGRALIDQDHAADKTPRRTEASGWITDVDLEDGVPMATVEWTPRGEKAIRDKEYLFLSPSFGPFENEKGEKFENTLQGAALTNRPHLSMPALQLASPENVKRAVLEQLDGDTALELLTLATTTADTRKKAVEAGNALPDGSYPIPDVDHLKAAAVLAASKHGDWKAALTLIRRRAKELGVDVNILAGFGSDDGKKLDDGPPEARPLLDRIAAEVEIGDVVTMKRVLRALEAVPGRNYEGAANVWGNGRAASGPQASVAEVLEAGGLNREQITEVAALVATIEAEVVAGRERFNALAPAHEKDRVYAGDALGVPEPVHLPEGFDVGPLANPEEQRRRLQRARDNDIGGIYAGKKGAERFHKEDEWAVGLKLDLPRSLERRTEINRAKAIMKNETGGVAQPLQAAVAARQEATALESDITLETATIEAEDRERVDLKRRGVWRPGLAPHSGDQREQRREKMVKLDDLKQSRAFQFESIPAYSLALEQVRGGGVKVKLLASELAGVGPADPFDQEALAAEQHEIDRRAQKFLLDHELPPDRYLEALAAVEAGRDRAEPVVPLRRPASPPETKLLDDSKGYSPEIRARVEEANRFMLENECDFMTALNAVEAGKTRLDQADG
jgi:hypothetical protein